MKHRVYLLITVLFVFLAFNISEARIVSPNSGDTIGPPSWSVTTPVKNNLSIALEDANSALQGVSTTRGKVPKPTNQSTTGSSKIPKKGTNKQPKRTHTGGGGGSGK